MPISTDDLTRRRATVHTLLRIFVALIVCYCVWEFVQILYSVAWSAFAQRGPSGEAADMYALGVFMSFLARCVIPFVLSRVVLRLEHPITLWLVPSPTIVCPRCATPLYGEKREVCPACGSTLQ